MVVLVISIVCDEWVETESDPEATARWICTISTVASAIGS